MGTFIASVIGALGGDAIKSIFKKGIILVAIIGLFFFIVTLIGITNYELPTSIYDTLTGSDIRSVFKAVDFFIPVDFILLCFGAIMTCRLLSFFWSLVLFIYNGFAKTSVSGGDK